jgi:hypothetical protein
VMLALPPQVSRPLCGLLRLTATRAAAEADALVFRAILTIASGMGVLMTRCGLQFAFSEKHR